MKKIFSEAKTMWWKGSILFILLLMMACEKEQEEIRFKVKIDGFDMKKDSDFTDPDGVKFVHKYGSCLISFTREEKTRTVFIQGGMIEDYHFSLIPGEYIMDVAIPEASIYGQALASFLVSPDTIVISELTDTITIHAEANCSLILVSDELDKLKEGPFIIERHSYAKENYKAYPMAWDSISGLYYSYFTPDVDIEDPSAFLWFYEEKPGIEEGGMPTSRFNVGYQYYISILE